MELPTAAKAYWRVVVKLRAELFCAPQQQIWSWNVSEAIGGSFEVGQIKMREVWKKVINRVGT